MRLHIARFWTIPIVVATSLASLVLAMEPATQADQAGVAELWQHPADIAGSDLFLGPWGASHAPDPHAVYTFVRRKTQGVNPGVVVRDPDGREWHVKQANKKLGDEGPPEVTLSRILSAIGYHQPPVYYLPSFTMADKSGTHVESGGRFRLHDSKLHDAGKWSWDDNPFAGTPPFNGLLVIFAMFNAGDLKSSNNTLYEVNRGGHVERWYVVRDLGSSLGETSSTRPKRNDLGRFERTQFIRGLSSDGFVEFDYHGEHRSLFKDRITPADVGWASVLLGQLSVRQWNDAFRAGGYDPDVAARYVDLLRGRVARGREIAASDQRTERR